MNTVEIIRRKRAGSSLNQEEIEYLISGFTNKKIPDYQFSAFLMAVYLKGMDKQETSFLTKSMLYSGSVVDLSEIKGRKIDKHSTGGVGDKTSLIIAPVCAAAGIYVPMISGRGLGHSGGTLDKLESIPGFRTDLDLNDYKRVLKECGAVLIGQTEEIAPADKLIYALRDVTATVESIPLITASIMSKKLSEGLDGLVLDVKTGSGAFMSEYTDALALAESLIDTSRAFGKEVIAFITDMNQPLGNYIGNWLEILEVLKILKGETEGNLYTLSLTLSGAMIYLGGKASTIDEGFEISEKVIRSGQAYRKFLEIVKLQKGDTSLLEDPSSYPSSTYKTKVLAGKEGYLNKIDTYEIGMAAVELGAGRKTKEDIIDMSAGIIFYPSLGDKVKTDTVIAELHSENKTSLEIAEKKISSALEISSGKPEEIKLIKTILNQED
jgi:pyrimidine-nucleoside phosphorylase